MTEHVDIPFVVTHGGWVWKLIVVGFTIATIALLEIIRAIARGTATRAEQRRRRAEIAKLTPAAAPANGHHTLRGILRGGSARSVFYGSKVHHERDAKLWLDCDGNRVELVGEVVVANGSKVVRTTSRAPSGIDRLAAATLDCDTNPKTMIIARDGDTVIVDGEIAIVAGTQDTMHRESAGGWAMSSTTLAVDPPRWAQPPAAWAPRIILAILAPIVSYAYLHHRGARVFEHDGITRDGLYIALAMPGSREQALALLDEQAPLSMRVAIAHARGDCALEARLLDEAEEFEAAIAAAKACGRPGLATESFVHLARYAEASDALATSSDVSLELRAEIHLAVGAWAAAAGDIQEAMDNRHAHCLSALLRTWAGEAATGVDDAHGCDREALALSTPPPLESYQATIGRPSWIRNIEARVARDDRLVAKYQPILDRWAQVVADPKRAYALYLAFSN